MVWKRTLDREDRGLLSSAVHGSRHPPHFICWTRDSQATGGLASSGPGVPGVAGTTANFLKLGESAPLLAVLIEPGAVPAGEEAAAPRLGTASVTPASCMACFRLQLKAGAWRSQNCCKGLTVHNACIHQNIDINILTAISKMTRNQSETISNDSEPY